MTLSPDHAWSLRRAGIGEVYHNKSLTDFGAEGEQLKTWMNNSKAQVAQGHSVLMTGLRCRELMMMVARGFHLNGLGVYVTPLVHAAKVLYDAETREQVKDNDILIITGFQQEGESPIKSSVAYGIEDLLNSRSDNGKCTFLTIPIGEPGHPFDPEAFEDWWWSMDIVDTLLDRYELLDMSSRERR